MTFQPVSSSQHHKYCQLTIGHYQFSTVVVVIPFFCLKSCSFGFSTIEVKYSPCENDAQQTQNTYREQKKSDGNSK